MFRDKFEKVAGVVISVQMLRVLLSMHTLHFLSEDVLTK